MALVIGTTYSKNGSSTGVSYLSAGIDYVLVSQNKTTNKSKIRIFPWMKTTTTNTAYNYNDRTATAKVGSLSKSGKTDYDMREATVNEKTYITSSVPFRRISGDFKLVDGRYCFEFDIPHNSDGVLNDLKIEVVIPSSNGASATDSTATVTVDLPQINRANTLSWNGKYIGDPIYFTVTKYNDSYTTSITLLWELENGYVHSVRGAEKTTDKSITFNLTEEDLQKILSENPNNKEVGVWIYAFTYDGDTQIGEENMYYADFSVKQHPPDVSAAIVDTNETTIALTGDSSIIVKYLSKPKVTIEAIAKQYASINKYNTEWGTKKSTTQETTFSQGIDSNVLTVKATDSRGWSNTKTYNLTDLNCFIDYEKIAYKKFDVTKAESSSEELTLDIEGTWFNDNFSESNSNEISFKYRYKTKKGVYGEYKKIELLTSDNTFTFNGKIGTFDISKQYDVEFVISDKAMELITTFEVLSNDSVLRVGETYVRMNGNLKLNGSLILNGIPYNPFDYLFITSKNENPKNSIGGEWSLVNKEFSSLVDTIESNFSDYYTDSDYATCYGIAFVRNSNQITIRISLRTLLDVDETNASLGKINLEKFGLTKLPLTKFGMVASSDTANSILIYNVLTTGEINAIDVIGKSGTNTISSGTTISIEISSTMNMGYMIDDFCDRFIWKRIS